MSTQSLVAIIVLHNISASILLSPALSPLRPAHVLSLPRSVTASLPHAIPSVFNPIQTPIDTWKVTCSRAKRCVSIDAVRNSSKSTRLWGRGCRLWEGQLRLLGLSAAEPIAVVVLGMLCIQYLLFEQGRLLQYGMIHLTPHRSMDRLDV